jgi:hypothetical protein
MSPTWGTVPDYAAAMPGNPFDPSEFNWAFEPDPSEPFDPAPALPSPPASKHSSGLPSEPSSPSASWACPRCGTLLTVYVAELGAYVGCGECLWSEGASTTGTDPDTASGKIGSNPSRGPIGDDGLG